MAPAGGRVGGGLGGGVLKEADEGRGGGELGTDGDEGAEDSGVAVWEVLDFEGEVTLLIAKRWCRVRGETIWVKLV